MLFSIMTRQFSKLVFHYGHYSNLFLGSIVLSLDLRIIYLKYGFVFSLFKLLLLRENFAGHYIQLIFLLKIVSRKCV